MNFYPLKIFLIQCQGSRLIADDSIDIFEGMQEAEMRNLTEEEAIKLAKKNRPNHVGQMVIVRYEPVGSFFAEHGRIVRVVD